MPLPNAHAGGAIFGVAVWRTVTQKTYFDFFSSITIHHQLTRTSGKVRCLCTNQSKNKIPLEHQK
jgi:hypothetical protein